MQFINNILAIMPYVQCSLCSQELQLNECGIVCTVCSTKYTFSESMIPNLIPQDIYLGKWVFMANVYAKACNEYSQLRIQKNDGWWLQNPNPYFELMRKYNLQSGRDYVVSMLKHVCSHGIIIDFCGGEGYVARMIAERLPMKNFKIISQDICYALQQNGLERTVISSISFLTSDCLHSGLKDGIADAIISTESIEHIRDMSRFINEVYRILRVGGKLYITTPNKSGFSFWFGERGIHIFLNFFRIITLRFYKVKRMDTYGFVDNEKGYECIFTFDELQLRVKREGFMIEHHFANQFLGEIFFIICEKIRIPLLVCVFITRLSMCIERFMCKFCFVSKILGFNQVLIARKP